MTDFLVAPTASGLVLVGSWYFDIQCHDCAPPWWYEFAPACQLWQPAPLSCLQSVQPFPMSCNTYTVHVVSEPWPNRLRPIGWQELTVAEWPFDPCDMNMDGARTLADVAAFPWHDWNEDGKVTSLDWADFLHAWANDIHRCP